MPKIAKELGPLAVGRLKGNRAHPVGGVPGLYLKIFGASRSWVLRIVVGNRRSAIGLGPYPAVSLAQARQKAQALREDVAKGIDPLRQKAAAKAALKAQQASSVTFEQAARDFIRHHESSWSNAKHAAQWLSSLETWAFPHIGSTYLQDITTAHILQVLKQTVDEDGTFWSARAETASRVRQRIEKIISAADVNAGLDRLNPARWEVISRTLPKVSKVKRVEHHPALPWQRIPEFMSALSKREGQAAKALAWTVLTAARSGETRGMTWAELDLDAKVWVVPASRMKADREHRVPLTDAAISLLGEVGAPEDLVFSAKKGSTLSDMTLSAVIKRMHQDAQAEGSLGWTDPNLGHKVATVHGMRSSLRDWAGDTTNHPREVVEAALSHKLGDAAELAYARSDLYMKRCRLMSDWADYCLGGSLVDGHAER